MTTASSGWSPTVETRHDVVTAPAARALHDLLDRDGPAPEEGDPLPALWHWLAFLPAARQSELEADGHPRTGGFLPPTAGRRRMYAGGAVTLHGTPRIGRALERTSTVTEVAHKSGRSGDLMFVTVEHRIQGDGGGIADRNDIVYRGTAAKPPADGAASARPAASAPSEPAGALADLDRDAIWGRRVAIDPTLLFRFSALTYNAHRIHYDRDYATGVEGHPGLVVHGPLQAVLLADAAARAVPGRRVTAFAFRSTSPAYDAHPLELRVRAGDEPHTVGLTAYSAGIPTMTATATFEETA